MENISWVRQTKEPAFPDVLWSRPQNKRTAGKLLVVGGHKQSFNAVSAAYSSALGAGIGTARVILPDSLQRALKGIFPEAEYAPSTDIGSFSRPALDTILEAANWADGVLLAGDFGHNSETAVLLESFSQKYKGQLTLAGDSLQYFLNKSDQILNRPLIQIACTLATLQKLAQPRIAIKQSDDLMHLLKKMGELSQNVTAGFITDYAFQIIVAFEDKQSTTEVKKEVDQVKLAAYVAVWWLQQPEKTFEALTTATWDYLQ
jgi:hypothetical protein